VADEFVGEPYTMGPDVVREAVGPHVGVVADVERPMELTAQPTLMLAPVEGPGLGG
jgi:hypothetical protein